MLGIALVSLLSASLLILGSDWPPNLRSLLILATYAVMLGLFCAWCVCGFQGLLDRLTTREAWLGAWGLVVICSFAFSYLAGVVGSSLSLGPGPAQLNEFMTKSVVGAAVVSFALLRYLYIRDQWQVEMVAESEARVQALQARIRPHFLFNSLNTIASLIHDDPDGAERATEDLAALFRGGMRSEEDLITLADELTLARRYLAMEQRRLGDRMTVEWDVDDLPGNEPVLPLLLQPLLENAVTHGIQPRPEGGTIQVNGRCEGGNIVITIANPVPMDGSRPGSGMALRNIRSRLALTYSSLASLLTHQDHDVHYAVLTMPHAEDTHH